MKNLYTPILFIVLTLVSCDDITHSVRVKNETNKKLSVYINGRDYGEIEPNSITDYQVFRKNNQLYGTKTFNVEMSYPSLDFDFLGNLQFADNEYLGYFYSEGLHIGDTRYTMRIFQRRNGDLEFDIDYDKESSKENRRKPNVCENQERQNKKLTETIENEAQISQEPNINANNLSIHPSLKNYVENKVYCQTERFIIRIDKLGNSEYRYASWNKPKTVSDEPNLVLYDFEFEFYGSIGGYSYTFKNYDWSYQIERINFAENDDDTGLFLSIINNDEVKASHKCIEIVD